jgi:hypothetical protein
MVAIASRTAGVTSRFSRAARASSVPKAAVTADSPSMAPIRAVGQAMLKSGSKPWEPIA